MALSQMLLNEEQRALLRLFNADSRQEAINNLETAVVKELDEETDMAEIILRTIYCLEHMTDEEYTQER